MSVPSHLIPPQTASPGLHVDSPDLATQPLKCLMQALWTSLAWQPNQLVHAASQHILPHGSEGTNDDDDETMPILYNWGLYFVSDLVLDKKAYRLPASQPIDTNQLAILYR